jgi:hypothetical protein
MIHFDRFIVDYQNKLHEYFNSQQLSDMILIVKNTPVYVHKVILYARSEFFRQLLETNPNEKLYRIQDDGVEVNLFIALLEYLYSDMFHSISKIPENQRDEFVKMCEEYASEHVPRIKTFLSLKKNNIIDSKMNSDMKKMFNNERFSDVAFKVDKETIKAHKVVICSRSEYFRALCLGGLRESTQQQIEIHNTPPFVFRKLIEYLYMQQINIEEIGDKIVEMFIVADKFVCDKLKEYLEFLIAQNLTVENASALILLAHKYSAPKLKQECYNFIQKEYKKLKGRRKYKEFEEVLERLIKRRKYQKRR